jgi:hypothetical protein
MRRSMRRPTRSWRVAAGSLTLVIGLAGCGGPAAPSASNPLAGGSASPIASPAGSVPDATGSAGPNTDAAAAIDAFLAFIETEQTFHLAADMQLTVAGKVVHMDVVSDVGKNAEKGFIDIVGAGVSLHLEVVLVNKVLYIKPARRDWQVIPIEASGGNPLVGLRSDDLVPIDIVNVAGTLTQHLHVADASDEIDAQTLSGNTLTDLKLDTATFDVYVTDDGVPLTAIYTFSGSGTFAGTPAPIQATIRYDFTKFGQDVSIVAPVAPSPAAP